MSVHTPAPWIVQVNHEESWAPAGLHIEEVVTVASGDINVAEVYSGRMGYDNSIANARLIAAAPDLLAALKAMVSTYQPKCEHEETTRGGNIWSICTQCQAQFADDEGGVPAVDNSAYDNARTAIDKAEGRK